MALTLKTLDRRNKSDRRLSGTHPLGAELRLAIERGELEIRFQPQFACRDDSLTGAEALIRWVHPLHGTMAGDAVCEIAALAGLEEALGRHVWERAVAAAAEWPGHLRLSLNVTAADLAEDRLVHAIEGALAASGFDAARLTVEITEQALVNDVAESADRLRDLAALGIRIALDDFGAGFCNFRYLKELPLHYLKLDRSMIEGIAEDRRDLAVLRGIMAMSHALGLEVIAEGIETEAQREVVSSEGCTAWQGFLGATPMSAAAFLRFRR